MRYENTSKYKYYNSNSRHPYSNGCTRKLLARACTKTAFKPTQSKGKQKEHTKASSASPALAYARCVLVFQQCRSLPAANTGRITATPGTTPYNRWGTRYCTRYRRRTRTVADNRHYRGTSAAAVAVVRDLSNRKISPHIIIARSVIGDGSEGAIALVFDRHGRRIVMRLVIIVFIVDASLCACLPSASATTHRAQDPKRPVRTTS